MIASSVFITRTRTVLLSAEMTARLQHDPSEHYARLSSELGPALSDRRDAPATPEQKRVLAALSPQQVRSSSLAGEKILQVITRAPGNNAPIGGLKVVAHSGWFAARPSGTEDIYKIYAESFRDESHLGQLFEEAQGIVSAALG